MSTKKNLKAAKAARASRGKSRSKLWLAIAIIAIVIIVVGVYAVIPKSGNQSNSEYSDSSTIVLLQTTAGNITLELRNDKPITTANFINIVNNGWYNGTIFHRVVSNFMIQGGQINQTVPAINDEIGNDNHNYAYTIAMAKTSSPNSATSEFFINTVDNSQITYSGGSSFDSTYTVFGKVISGLDVVSAISNGAVTTDPSTGEDSVPLNPVTIISASVIS